MFSNIKILCLRLLGFIGCGKIADTGTTTGKLPKTGQTKCYSTSGSKIPCAGTGQDGELQKGIASPNPRFQVDTTDNCVIDNQTGLMWSKDANMWGELTWQSALDKVKWLNQSGGLCGWTDWRLPNINELKSLVDVQNYSPALPTGHLFSNVQSSNNWSHSYWSSTMIGSVTIGAWIVNMDLGRMTYGSRTTNYYVWPVRLGQ